MDVQIQSIAVNGSHIDIKKNPSSDTEYAYAASRKLLNDFVCENIFFYQKYVTVLSFSY